MSKRIEDFIEEDQREMYNKLVCALTHDLSVCEKCKKCGSNWGEARTNLIRDLSWQFGYPLPWEEVNKSSV